MPIDINSFVAAGASQGLSGIGGIGGFNAANLVSGSLLGIPTWQVAGISIGLIIATILLLLLLKRIIENIILGLVAWAVLAFIFHIELPLVPTFVLTVAFGLAGVGAMLLAKLLGVA